MFIHLLRSKYKEERAPWTRKILSGRRKCRDKEEEKKLTKRKPSKKVNLASLKEMKEKIQEAIEVDSRGL